MWLCVVCPVGLPDSSESLLKRRRFQERHRFLRGQREVQVAQDWEHGRYQSEVARGVGVFREIAARWRNGEMGDSHFGGWETGNVLKWN